MGIELKQLSVRHEKFCEGIAAGLTHSKAYLQAGWVVSEKTAAERGCKLSKNDKIQARIAELRVPQTREALRKKDDNLRYLASVITTPLSEIGPDSPLCTEYTEEIIAGGSRGKLKRGQSPQGNEIAGPDIIRRRVKKSDPLRAIELYSRLQGHFEPDRTEIDIGPKTLLSIKERAAQVELGLARKYEPPE